MSINLWDDTLKFNPYPCTDWALCGLKELGELGWGRWGGGGGGGDFFIIQ